MDTKRLKEILDTWSMDEDSTYLGDFIILTGIDPDDLDDFCASDEDFNLALKHAKLRIAKRLRAKLGKKGYSSALFAREIGMYDLLLAKHEKEMMQLDQMIKKDLGETSNFVNLTEYIKKIEEQQHEERSDELGATSVSEEYKTSVSEE
jgi:hypothetical protein